MARAKNLRQAAFPVIQGMLKNALQHHRAMRLGDAERIYRQILAIDAYNADCLHLLGMIAFQAGSHETAIELIRQAIAINNTDSAYHSNLGTVFQSQGRLEDAAECYRDAVALMPLLAEAHYNLGNVLHAQDKLEEATVSYRRALALKPDLAEAHYNLGNALHSQDKLDEAIACHEQALIIQPDKYEALHNLGNVFQSQDRIEEALACFEQVLALQPGYAKAHYSAGCALHTLGKVGSALGRYRKAQAMEPELAQAFFSESLAQLLQGDYAAGWKNFEWRWRIEDHDTVMRQYPQPLWKGEELATGHVLIWGEQGIGDEIMFAGLISDVVGTGNRCVLDCDPRLNPLFARSFPGIEIVSVGKFVSNDAGDHEPKIAAHLPSGSLPGLFRTNRAAFAATPSPYLVADPKERQRFRTQYADGRRLVGLAWHTNNRKTGRVRSIDLSLLAPLFAQPDVRWISLQYGDHDSLENAAGAANAPLVIDRSVDQFADIDRFAAQISAMDLVVTIDNSTAHLAGALGVPTLVLLPFVPDWRWLLAGEECPWYPTLRLFRQSKRGDWLAVLQRVGHAL